MGNEYTRTGEIVYNNRIYHEGDIIRLSDGAIYLSVMDTSPSTYTDTSWRYQITEIWGSDGQKPVMIKYLDGSPYHQGVSGCIHPAQISEGGTQYQSTYYFNANGGTGEPGPVGKTYGQPAIIPTGTPTRDGYNFVCWYETVDGTYVELSPGETYWGPDHDINFYAKWNQNRYTISFNANGGTGAPAAQTKLGGTNLTLSSTKPTRSGYTFVGWTDSPNGQKKWDAGGIYMANASATLYAIWQVNSYTLTINPNGGTWSGSTGNQSFTQNYGTTKSIANPTRPGYTFAGWSRNGSGSVSGTTFTFGAGNCTLTATWNINSYMLTVNPNGGVWNGSGVSQNFSQNYNTTKAVANPSRTGYTFKGWTLSGGGSMSGTTYRYGTSNGTLTAVWQIITYTVTFNASANGGSPNSTKGVNHGAKIGTLPTPVRPYYKFVGWFTQVHGGAQISTGTVITSNVTYYAQYKIDASATLNIGGNNKPVIAYVRTGGVWKKALSMVKIDGRWRNSTGSS
ncbi:MAG: hypothetical protein EOM34_04665 [Clostridia bacterium]|nr:hypothetical protein [Clostridia bacterium]